ncbi:phospholipase D-like domain-containing protein [Vagococcus acidifermentans]|uniref:restriction endonuclease PLD domain-containing protein n=1 Tax=Vagococcus acidifermentans TaxID=564710 RepID=UPI001476AB22|nr:restriction endonuclease PLD domain-containing protein [Vagococcus acidifermentans]
MKKVNLEKGHGFKIQDADSYEHVVLPLYSSRTKKVEIRSGLNQWNASGRSRNMDEVYIPIPSWIHQKFKGFFKYSLLEEKSAKNSPPFEVELPNKNLMTCKVAQDNGKGLMSNPNKELGKWILRDVLNLKSGTIVTKDLLDEIGIDSVILTKINNDKYKLDFAKSGTYEKFYKDYR